MEATCQEIASALVYNDGLRHYLKKPHFAFNLKWISAFHEVISMLCSHISKKKLK
jgi:hypothetical protein